MALRWIGSHQEVLRLSSAGMPDKEIIKKFGNDGPGREIAMVQSWWNKQGPDDPEAGGRRNFQIVL